MQIGVVVRPVRKDAGIVARIEHDQQTAVGPARLVHQGAQVEDLLPRIEIGPEAVASRRVVGVETNAGQVAARGSILLVDQLDHVRVAWFYLRQKPLLAALESFVTGLKRFAAAHGKPGLYHETITWAYLLLIHERRERMTSGHSWDEFAAANAHLLQWRPSILKRYYRDETLASDFARRVFVLPDRGL